MTINARRFELGKNRGLDQVIDFLSEQGLGKDQILMSSVVQIAPGNAALLLVYEDAPYVSGTSPAAGASGVVISTNIIIVFNEPIKNPTGKVTITQNGVTLIEGVDYTFTPNPWPVAGSATLTISGAIDATYLANYIVMLSGITDLNDEPMSGTYVFSFVSQSEPAGGGTVIQHGSAVPDGTDISNGYIDVTFGAVFDDTSYQIALTVLGSSAQMGVGLRISNKTVSGFRINFDGEDYSTVEVGVDTSLSGAVTDVDNHHLLQINDQHANIDHAAPQNEITYLTTTLSGATDCENRAFVLGNTIEWIAIRSA